MAEPRLPGQWFRASGVTIIKRSTAITLILVGTGTAAYVASTQSRVCHNDLGQEVPCRSSRSGGGYWGYSSGTSSQTAKSTATVSRGGFGSTASGMSSGS